MSARVDELRKRVLEAKQGVESAQRVFNEYASGLHVSKQILAEREEKLAEVIKLEDEERRQ